ncbi:hypothetical protein [Streptomyces xantholiticus]
MRPLPRSLSGWTMAVFGVLAALLGLLGLIAPDALLTAMGFDPIPDSRRTGGDHTLVFLAASSMAALNMAVYYILASPADWQPFFRTRFGGAPVAALDAVTSALAAGIFALMRVQEPEPARRRRGRHTGTLEGARLLWHSAPLRPLILGGAVTMGLAGLNGALIYAVADTVLGRSPAFVGLLYAVQGVGSVVSGLLAGPLLRRLPERVYAAAGLAVFAAAAALRALPYDAVALACSAAIGLGLPCVLIAAMTAVQRETPAASVGRTAATANTMLFVPNAVALALGAGLVAVADVRVLLVAVGGAGAGAALLLATARAAVPTDVRVLLVAVGGAGAGAALLLATARAAVPTPSLPETEAPPRTPTRADTGGPAAGPASSPPALPQARGSAPGPGHLGPARRARLPSRAGRDLTSARALGYAPQDDSEQYGVKLVAEHGELDPGTGSTPTSAAASPPALRSGRTDGPGLPRPVPRPRPRPRRRPCAARARARQDDGHGETLRIRLHPAR